MESNTHDISKDTKRLYIYLFILFIAWLVLIYLVFFGVPSDAEQGVAQRIFYFHVPTAWAAFISLSLCFYFSIKYLMSREMLFDTKAFVYAKIGWVLTTGVLITGPLWAKPIWGVYWNWSDQRLMTFFILWLIFSSYFIFRKSVRDVHKAARFSAVIAVLGFLDIPLVYFSIRIWDTPSHPGPIIGSGAPSMSLDPKMRFALWYSFICFLGMIFLIARVQIRSLQIRRLLLERKHSPVW